MNPWLLGVLVFIFSSYQAAIILQLYFLRKDLLDLFDGILSAVDSIFREDLS